MGARQIFILFCVIVLSACGGKKADPYRGNEVSIENRGNADGSGSKTDDPATPAVVTAPVKPLACSGPIPKASRSPQPLKIVTMNLKWFGSGGRFDKYASGRGRCHPSWEYRQANFKRFFSVHYPQTDVFVFQEVVWPDQLAQVLPEHNCTTYEAPGVCHQHVVTCVKKPLRFELSACDSNFEFEPVALSFGYRPALHGMVIHPTNGLYLQVVGLHLKAGRASRARREQQILRLLPLLKATKSIPTVLLGDVNTHPAGRSHEARSISKIFDQQSLGLLWKTAHLPSTSAFRRASLDHIWVSDSLQTSAQGQAFEVCRGLENHYSRQDFREEISDHCPVQIEVQ